LNTDVTGWFISWFPDDRTAGAHAHPSRCAKAKPRFASIKNNIPFRFCFLIKKLVSLSKGMNDYRFQVIFLEEVKDFLDNLQEKVRDKIFYNIWKARSTNDKELFKKLQDEVWEFRTLYNKTYYRLLLSGTRGQNRDGCNLDTRTDKENGQNS